MKRGITAVCLLALVAVAMTRVRAAERNVVLVVADDLGLQKGC